MDCSYISATHIQECQVWTVFLIEQTRSKKLVQLNFNPWFQINIHEGLVIDQMYERVFTINCSSKWMSGSYFWEYCYSIHLQEVNMLVSPNSAVCTMIHDGTLFPVVPTCRLALIMLNFTLTFHYSLICLSTSTEFKQNFTPSSRIQTPEFSPW